MKTPIKKEMEVKDVQSLFFLQQVAKLSGDKSVKEPVKRIIKKLEGGKAPVAGPEFV